MINADYFSNSVHLLSFDLLADIRIQLKDQFDEYLNNPCYSCFYSSLTYIISKNISYTAVFCRVSNCRR